MMSFTINVFGAASESDRHSRSPAERLRDRRRTLQAVLDRLSQRRSENEPEPIYAALDFAKPSSAFDKDEDDDADMQQLLARIVGDALPGHPGLRQVCLLNVQEYSKYVGMLADSLVAATGARLADRRPILVAFNTSKLDAPTAGAISSLLRRSGPVHRLNLWNCAMGTENLKRICDGLQGNGRLLHFVIDFQQDGTTATTTMERETVARAVDGTSSVEDLSIRGAQWTDDAVLAFWFRLRTNDKLEQLHVAGLEERHQDAFALLLLVTLSRYNWTLRFVSIDGMVSLRAVEMLAENATIRLVASALEDRAYNVADTAVWPRIMGRVSSKPTLLYRFLRRGNLDAWSDHVAGLGRLPRGRRRETTSDDEESTGKRRAAATN